MKYFKVLTVVAASLLVLISCSINENSSIDNNNVDIYGEDTVLINLSQSDIDALLFMLEEEKLARDTYSFLNGLWSLNIFGNIKNSEQSHMDAVKSLLDLNLIQYTILSDGEFNDSTLQDFYNQFVIDGGVSIAQALKVGATIEDLDIVDLEDFINLSSNES